MEIILGTTKSSNEAQERYLREKKETGETRPLAGDLPTSEEIADAGKSTDFPELYVLLSKLRKILEE